MDTSNFYPSRMSRREALKLLASLGGVLATANLLSREWPVAKADLQPTQATTIEITNSGFQPSSATVSVGSVVTWINKTNTTYTLKITPPTYQQTYLPMVMGGKGAARNPEEILSPQQTNTHELAPNAALSYTFEAWGHHQITVSPNNFMGEVVVPQANFTAGTYLISISSNASKLQVAYKEEPGWVIVADPGTVVRSAGPVYGVDWIEGAPWRVIPRNFNAPRQPTWPSNIQLSLQVNFGPNQTAPAPGTLLWCYVTSGGQGGEYVVECQLALKGIAIVGNVTLDLPAISSGFSPYFCSFAFKDRVITTRAGQKVDTASFIVPGIKGYSGLA